nr:hypothetical protein [Kibdelosporangium sp. MJ126-NF4]
MGPLHQNHQRPLHPHPPTHLDNTTNPLTTRHCNPQRRPYRPLDALWFPLAGHTEGDTPATTRPTKTLER